VIVRAALAPVAEEQIAAAIGAKRTIVNFIRAEPAVEQLPDVGAIQIHMALAALLLP